ncbi:MAG: hypothetical protein FWG31_09230 [Oscillospiraceae bacterium]|nr:hypothetical protein [Oscillospiraceae bacterium]
MTASRLFSPMKEVLNLKKGFGLLLLLCFLLSGCSETQEGVVTPEDEPVSTPSAHVDVADDDIITYSHRRGQAVEIPIGEGTVFAEEVLKLIETSKKIREGDEDYALFSESELSKITEFYSLDKFSIEGFELGSVFVGSAGFMFQYFRDKNKTTGMYGRIVIGIDRQDWIDAHMPDTDLLKHRIKLQDPEGIRLNEDDLLLKDDMLYYVKADMVEVQLGRTAVTIQPHMIGRMGYEELRDLAFLLIETAELVTVKG